MIVSLKNDQMVRNLFERLFAGALLVVAAIVASTAFISVIYFSLVLLDAAVSFTIQIVR